MNANYAMPLKSIKVFCICFLQCNGNFNAENKLQTCHHIEIISRNAMTRKEKVLRTAHMMVRHIYIHKKTLREAKYPPPLLVPVDKRMIICNACDPE